MKGLCSICHQDKTVHLNRKTGQLVCQTCYKHKFYHKPLETCFYCHELKAVTARTADGQPICHTCYQHRKVGKCVECGEEKIIQALGMCYTCYQCQRRAKMAVSLT